MLSQKKAYDTLGSAARFCAERLAAQSEEVDHSRRDALVVHGTYVSGLSELYLLTVLSGKKGVYNFVGDKLEKMTRLEQTRHKVGSAFYGEMVDAINNSPDALAAILEKQEARGAIRPDQFFIKKALLLGLVNSLDYLKPHADEAQAVYQAAARAAAHNPAHQTLNLPIETVKELLDSPNQSPNTLSADNAHIQEEAVDTIVDISEGLQLMQLNWEVLPPGNLEQVAKEMVADIVQKNPHRTVRIDLSRLNALHDLRETWGPEYSYYARGRLHDRGKVAGPDGTTAPEEYIVLILQEADSQGRVTAEHAVAESPVAERNAAYVYRQGMGDSNYTWREVMSMEKPAARDFGARAVPHRKVNGQTIPESMALKFTHLLMCSPQEFHQTGFKSMYRRALGATALESVDAD